MSITECGITWSVYCILKFSVVTMVSEVRNHYSFISQEVGGSLIGEDRLVEMAGAE